MEFTVQDAFSLIYQYVILNVSMENVLMDNVFASLVTRGKLAKR
jgi:hypothetical protein